MAWTIVTGECLEARATLGPSVEGGGLRVGSAWQVYDNLVMADLQKTEYKPIGIIDMGGPTFSTPSHSKTSTLHFEQANSRYVHAFWGVWGSFPYPKA